MRDGKFVSSHTKETIVALDFCKKLSENEGKPIHKFFGSLTFPLVFFNIWSCYFLIMF